MFDVGFWELVLIFMLGLMVLGPEKLPRIAAQLGRWVGRARRTATQLRYQLEREIDLNDKPRPRYTPPPKTSHIVPPPGKQSSTPADAPEDGATAGSATASTPSPAETDPADVEREHDSGT
jgi:sec-independent protein translocase protein TatB